MAALGVVPASRVAMDTSSLLIAFGRPLTFKAPAPKLIISDEFNNFAYHHKIEYLKPSPEDLLLGRIRWKKKRIVSISIHGLVP